MGDNSAYLKLTDDEIYSFLAGHNFALLGFDNGKRNYSVPVTFVCDGNSIVSRLVDPRALELVAGNPTVTFQADLRKGRFNWTSIVGIGNCEILGSPVNGSLLQALDLAELKNGTSSLGETFVRIDLRHLAGRRSRS